MKKYDSEEVKSWQWVKIRDYVPASDNVGNYKILNWGLIEKFPISKIKFNPDNYPNKLNNAQVFSMIEEFYPFAFTPILIDRNNELKDGLHRLTFAIWSGLEYIDVFVCE